MAETTRIDLPCGEWIEIKARRSWANTKRIESASVRIGADESGEHAMGVDLLEQAIASITTYVVAWSLPAPLSRATLLSEDFDGQIGDEIEIAIAKAYSAQGRDRVGKSD